MTFATSVDRPRATDLVDLACDRCQLNGSRTQVVPAEGPRTARLFLVGEAPGPDEDAQGRPFVGRAGKILRRSLDAAGIPADDVWISNTVKCFPHDLVEGGKRRIRKPSTEEATACRPWLRAEVKALRPALLVALGGTAAQELTGQRGIKIGDVRGKRLSARDELGGVPVVVTYHPSGLRYGHATEQDLVDDLRAAYAHVASRGE